MRNGDFQLEKVLGSESPADILTKFTDKQILRHMLNKHNMTFEGGRADSAPQIAAVFYKVTFSKSAKLPKA